MYQCSSFGSAADPGTGDTINASFKIINRITSHENNLKIRKNIAGQFGPQPCTITVDFLTRTPFGCT
jgi:hypothetical protein